MTDHATRAHAILAPSFMKIALACSGAVGLKEKAPKQPQTEASAKGTKIHEAAAMLLEDFLAHKENGTDPEIRAHLLLEPEVKKVAEGWRDIIWEKFFGKTITGNFVYGIEDKLVFSEKFDCWGTADFWGISIDERARRFGYIADLKTGYVFVDLDGGQLPCYACALIKEAEAKGLKLEYVVCALYQPFGEGEKYRTVKFTAKQLAAWEKKFNKLASEVYSDKQKFKAGKHCKYCPGQTLCKKYDEYRQKETGLAFLNPVEFKFPDVAVIPDDALVRIIKHEDALKSFVKACATTLYNKLMQGQKIDGVKLVEANTKRKWDETRLDELAEKLKQHSVELYEKSPKGLTAIKDELAASLTKKEADSVITSFAIKPKGNIVLAEADDSRSEVSNTHNVFTEITENE